MDKIQAASNVATLPSSSLLGDLPPLLSMAQLASLLDRSPNGLRVALAEASPYAIRLNAAKLKIGRRVYFLRDEIERFLLDQNRAEKLAVDALGACQ